MLKKLFGVLSFAILAFPSVALSADPVAIDYTALTGAVDVAPVSTAIMTVAGTLIGLYLVIFGTRKVIGMIRGG